MKLRYTENCSGIPRLRRFIVWMGLCSCAVGLPLLTVMVGANTRDKYRGCRFIGYSDFASWERPEPPPSDSIDFTSPENHPGIPWDELVFSWNAKLSAKSSMRVEARGIFPDHSTRWYTMGLWSGDRSLNPRESVKNQKDEDGEVQTDTLVLKRTGAKVQLKVCISGDDPSNRLTFIGLSFSAGKPPFDALPPTKKAWGKELDVPEKSQLSYKGGEPWCSPTSTAMSLCYWSKTLKKPELDRDVP